MLEETVTLLKTWTTNCYDYGKNFDELFDLCLEDLDPKASTGLGAMSLLGATIGVALGWNGVVYDSARVDLFRSHVRARLHNPREADPILVFVKPEPHKLEKIREERYRIISAVGLIDTMVDRIQFRWLQEAVLANVGKTGVAIGWSPYNGGYRLLTTRFQGEKVLCADRSTWDWTMQGWLLLLVKDIIKELSLGAPQEWRDWVDIRWEVLFRDAEFGFRSGERVRQNTWGVMKSGCYLTIFINSVAQICMHSLACRRLRIDPEWAYFYAIGDDTIQRPMGNLTEYLAELEACGAIIKEWKVSKTVEFAGHVMRGLYLRPTYTDKHVFKLMSANDEQLAAMLQAYQAAYVMDDGMWDWLSRTIARVAPALSRTRARALTLVVGD